MTLDGPAIILNSTSTILLEPNTSAFIDDYGNVEITLLDCEDQQEYKKYENTADVPLNAIELSIFGHRFMSIAE